MLRSNMQGRSRTYLSGIVADVIYRLGYQVHDTNIIGKLSGWLNWQLRTLDKVVKPSISPYHQSKILRKAVSLSGATGDIATSVDSAIAGKVTELFRAGMETYLMERQYVTKPQQALEATLKKMR